MTRKPLKPLKMRNAVRGRSSNQYSPLRRACNTQIHTPDVLAQEGLTYTLGV